MTTEYYLLHKSKAGGDWVTLSIHPNYEVAQRECRRHRRASSLQFWFVVADPLVRPGLCEIPREAAS